MSKKLYRDSANSTIGGVCAGLSEYFSVDVTLIRVLFAVAFIAAGSGLLLYIILWIVLPDKRNINASSFQETNYEYKPFEPVDMKKNKEKERGNVIGGLILITIGLIFLVDQFLPWFSFGKLWPLILVAIGIGLLWNNLAEKKDKDSTNSNE
jgi:phage shock protein C